MVAGVLATQGVLVGLVLFNLGLTFQLSSRMARHLGWVDRAEQDGAFDD